MYIIHHEQLITDKEKIKKDINIQIVILSLLVTDFYRL